MKYSNYLAENLDKNIVYEEYIIEQLGDSIDYANYVAEQLSPPIMIDEIKRKRLERKIERQKRKRNGKLKDVMRNI